MTKTTKEKLLEQASNVKTWDDVRAVLVKLVKAAPVDPAKPSVKK